MPEKFACDIVVNLFMTFAIAHGMDLLKIFALSLPFGSWLTAPLHFETDLKASVGVAKKENRNCKKEWHKYCMRSVVREFKP